MSFPVVISNSKLIEKNKMKMRGKTMSIKRIAVALAVLLSAAVAAQAAVINVPGDQATIALALAAAADNDVINIAAGTYTESGLAPADNNLIIQGAGPSSTIVQAAAVSDTAADRVFNVAGAINVTISGMTVRNGKVDGVYGGGILCDGAALTVTGCEIVDNYAIGNAGGGGIAASGSGRLVLDASTVYNNTAEYRGGGLAFASSVASTIRNATICSNTSNRTSGVAGGGIYVYNTDVNAVSIVNSTISGNSAPNAGTAGGIGVYDGTVNLINTLVAGNIDSVSPDVDDRTGNGIFTDSYCLIGSNAGATSSLTAGTPNPATQSYIGSSGSEIDADLQALASNGGPTRTMAPNGTSIALRKIGRGVGTAFYNGSPPGDQRNFFISSPPAAIDNPDYLSRTIGAYWDNATATPARGFDGKSE